ncbi:ELMO/CED-12 family [Musa troglodytarum]|uniref:ELMO/CED-12 family n=1 Tax=Musa troglodytarum TaxID=320322 RepID=A0A9E7H259_9LILI|nr:ELMO/CED-12 family [Musa troglodytarum]
MAARTIRRLHHGDIDGRRNEYSDSSGFDALNEPLLGNNNRGGHYNYKGRDDGGEQDWDDKKKEINLHWTHLFANLIAQWSRWLVYATGIYFIAANIILGSGSVLGRFLPISSIASNEQDDPNLSLSLAGKEERYRNLRLRMEVQFDGSRLDHQDALKQLWRLAYPNREVPPLKSESWKEMGWQGCDPSTDFRGGGYISLENLIFFAKNYPNSFQTLLHKTEGSRADWEYPFAIAGVNISFMLIQMLDLQSVLPSSKAGVRFLELLGEDEKAFDNLYCIAFRMLDAQWLEVLKSTRNQLERELALEDIASVKDLPAYNMLM